jgi:hypothetical protein
MAKHFTVTQLGAQPQTRALEDYSPGLTAGDLMGDLDIEGASIKVNGKTVTEDYEIQEYDFVSFGEKVKGGAQA